MSRSDIEVDEAEDSGYINGPLYEKFFKVAEIFSASSVGQYVTGKIDNLLKLIEDTAKWSLPPRNRDKNESSTPLERPLPWIPFIALILLLRLVRVSLSVAGLFIGNAPLVPSDIVYFIQTRRRKLRSMRIAGMKEIQKREQERVDVSRTGLFSSLTSFMSKALCRPQLNEDVNNILVNEHCSGKAECSGVQKIQHNHKSSKNTFDDEQISENELTLDQILDKYAASSNDEDDSDFIPTADALLDADTSRTSSQTSEEDTNDEQETIENMRNKVMPTISNTNMEINSHMSNGNISIESDEANVGTKVNGTNSKKNKVMPKPLLPSTQSIKQEALDSDEDRNIKGSENSPEIEVLGDRNSTHKDNDIYSSHHQQSIVENENQCKASNSKIPEDGNDQHVDGMNGNRKLSESGSPDLCSAYGHGFNPTSILKNPQAVNSERREHIEAFVSTADFIRGESTNESTMVSKQTKNANSSGKPIKNKFRGKRR